MYSNRFCMSDNKLIYSLTCREKNILYLCVLTSEQSNIFSVFQQLLSTLVSWVFYKCYINTFRFDLIKFEVPHHRLELWLNVHIKDKMFYRYYTFNKLADN